MTASEIIKELKHLSRELMKISGKDLLVLNAIINSIYIDDRTLHSDVTNNQIRRYILTHFGERLTKDQIKYSVQKLFPVNAPAIIDFMHIKRFRGWNDSDGKSRNKYSISEKMAKLINKLHRQSLYLFNRGIPLKQQLNKLSLEIRGIIRVLSNQGKTALQCFLRGVRVHLYPRIKEWRATMREFNYLDIPDDLRQEALKKEILRFFNDGVQYVPPETFVNSIMSLI